jgi:peroxiredoxin Q/BCP
MKRFRRKTMTMPTVGTLAPDFVLNDQAGRAIRLSELLSRRVVLYFYPRADTPGCTQEACSFRDDMRAYGDLDVVVLGVSPDREKDQARFAGKHGLPFPLLADVDRKVSEAYGVWGLKKFMGREYMGVHRTTFLIGVDGRITHVFPDVKPDAHSREVLSALRTERAPG